MTNVRQSALHLLNKCESARQYSNLALDSAIKSGDFSQSDKALLTALVYGVIERKITLDYYINALSSRKTDKIEPDVKNILRLGLYQLIYLDRIPPHAAINESVELCSRRTKGFVNAILREYARRGNEIALPDKNESFIEYLSVKYSFPAPLCERIANAYGVERAEGILSAFCKEPGMTLRANTLKTTRESLIAACVSHGINATPTENSPYGLKISHASVGELNSFARGEFFVQDEASQLSTAVLDAKAGEKVLDVCACPGSKSFGAAICMENRGELLSFDLHKSKLSLIEKGAADLGITIIKASEHDARDFIPELKDVADRIICDVPCSGFGVVAKKPEIRYKDLAESDRLPTIQLAILNNVSRYLRVGGTLVYSTCTILPEENEHIINEFLREHKDFALEPFKVGNISSDDGMLTLLPDIHGTDGFFIAKLIKKDQHDAN